MGENVNTNHADLRKEMHDMRAADDAAHSMLIAQLGTIGKQQVRMQTITEERANAEGTLRKQVFALVLLFLGSMGGRR